MATNDQMVVFHLSSDDPIKAGKALRLAKKSLDYVGKSVIYVDCQGVKIVQRSTGGFTIPGTDMNSLDVIREFLADGGLIFAGKECMKIFDISVTDIIAGCEQADPATTFKYLLGEDTKLISW